MVRQRLVVSCSCPLIILEHDGQHNKVRMQITVVSGYCRASLFVVETNHQSAFNMIAMAFEKNKPTVLKAISIALSITFCNVKILQWLSGAYFT